MTLESATPPTKLTHRQVLIVFSGLMLGMLLAALDQTIVATALPTIVGDLGGLNHLSWVVTAYLLTSTASVPLYGKISDLYGRKRVFQFAIVLFLVGSVISGAAQNMVTLIIARGIQGMGGGGTMSRAANPDPIQNSHPIVASGRHSTSAANILFSLYYQAGAERSLARLHTDLRSLGVGTSLTTLKRYSAKFDWQGRIARLDEEAGHRNDDRSLERIAGMNERQSQLGRSLQGAAASAVQTLLRDGSRLRDITPAELSRLADVGTRLERLAMGEATERQDLIVGAWNSALSSATARGRSSVGWVSESGPPMPCSTTLNVSGVNATVRSS